MKPETLKKLEEKFKLKPSEFFMWLNDLFIKKKTISLATYKELNRLYEEKNNLNFNNMVDEVFSESPRGDFVIREPIWETKSVGLDEGRLEDVNRVRITYRDKDEMPLFPHIYEISKTAVLAYPQKRVEGNKLRIVPISALRIT